MGAWVACAAFALLVAVARPAAADEAMHCLSAAEQRTAITEGKAVPLAAARRAARQKMPGELVRARLCWQKEHLIYLLTVLARDGKVARVAVDAKNGAVISEL